MLNQMSHSNPMGLLEILDSQHTAPSLLSSDRLSNRDSSIANVFAHRSMEQENYKMDGSLRALSVNTNTSPWTYPPHRSVLNSISDTSRATDVLSQNILSGGLKRLSVRSPLISSPALTNVLSHRGCQAQVWLKLESVQPTGSFKIRGMENVCRKWCAAGVNHVVCPSGGNAAIAAAYSAQAYGLACTVVVPEASEAFIRRRLSLEAPDTKVIVHGSDWAEAHKKAEQLVNQANHVGETAVRLLHPFDQPDLWEGYESIIDECTPEIGQPDVVVVSVGGGGLLAGVIQGLWNRGWSSTHVIAVETEGADCLNRSVTLGQPVLLPRASSIATSLVYPVIAHRSWNLAQLQSFTPVTCSDLEALDAVKHFIDDHGILVEPASGAALSVVYSGIIGRLQHENRIPRPANVVIVVGGGRNVSLRQLSEWEAQLNPFGPDTLGNSFLPTISNPYLTRTSPHTAVTFASDLSNKSAFGHQDQDETLKIVTPNPCTPRAVVHSILSSSPPVSSDAHNGGLLLAPTLTTDRAGNSDTSNGALNPHDLVNFSKLLATSEGDGDEVGLHDQ